MTETCRKIEAQLLWNSKSYHQLTSLVKARARTLLLVKEMAAIAKNNFKYVTIKLSVRTHS